MIAPDRKLEALREQLARLEHALESLSREIRPTNEQLFRVMAEGYVDHIAQLRLEIDQYLGVASITPSVGRFTVTEGEIREVDLDQYTFHLRGRGTNQPELLCEYDELLRDKVRELLGERARVKGWMRVDPATLRQRLEVERIDALTAEARPPVDRVGSS